jgi:hypothetical protein
MTDAPNYLGKRVAWLEAGYPSAITVETLKGDAPALTLDPCLTTDLS